MFGGALNRLHGLPPLLLANLFSTIGSETRDDAVPESTKRCTVRFSSDPGISDAL